MPGILVSGVEDRAVMRARLGIAVAGAAIALAAIPLLAHAPQASASTTTSTLNSARIEHRGTTQEIHFGFDGPAPRLNLSTHASELSIELGRTRIGVPPRPLFGYESPPIKSVRAIDDADGQRIIVDVAGKADYAIARLKHEIILRIASSGADPNIAAPIIVHHGPAHNENAPNLMSSPKPAPPPRPALADASPAPEYHYNGPAFVRPPAAQIQSAASSANYAAGHPFVMIDPGHGGYDPGTQSATGVEEKDVALDISKRLVAALQARGIHAELTRSTDEFISLPERTRRANQAGADLFVSVHLNSSPNPDTSGIEVYYLNNTTDRATIRLARMENGAAAASGTQGNSNLNYILADLRQNYKAEESASLAGMIDAQTVADLDAGFGLKVNALGAKMGPFYVLVGAHMPAVLIECGFLSNATEAARLSSAVYQDTIAGAAAAAVVHYFNADLAVGNL